VSNQIIGHHQAARGREGAVQALQVRGEILPLRVVEDAPAAG
jgi:hypothetical protein